MGWIEYYKSVKEDRSGMEKLIPEIEKDINRLEQVAERFSKIGSAPDLISHDLNLVLEKTVLYFQKRAPKHISIELYDQKNAFANINAPLFSWVIENLVSNAFNAIKDWLVSSVLNFADFLGLTPDVKFNNTVNW